jgi:EAL domain-containing protein (putative c-di-GMP-specific phosphodiesterase class I)
LESSIISKFEQTTDIIQKCNNIGIEFSLDDFGTKYSSLNYLVNFPFKFMKVDAEFIFNVINNEKDTKILMAILDIATAINIKVIAEGAETKEHMQYLLNLGCEFGQGYAISKPMPAKNLKNWYKLWNKNYSKNKESNK